jgi:hypothetical protein
LASIRTWHRRSVSLHRHRYFPLFSEHSRLMDCYMIVKYTHKTMISVENLRTSVSFSTA